MRRGRGRIDMGLAVAVVAAYLPVLHAELLAWDDNLYVTENPHVQGLSLRNVLAAFTTIHVSGNWIPLTWMSHMLDVAIWGLAPAGHHATSLALHVVNTLLVFHVLERLTGARWRSAAVAALFGLHPLHVESVAWIAERKDVLSTACWLLAVSAYARYVRLLELRWALAVAAWFVAGLLAKPMVVTLPFVLLLLDYWPFGRLSAATVREKLPLVGLAAAASAVTFVAQRTMGALHAGMAISLGDRVANAIVAYVRYLELAVWPAGLSPWYSHPASEGVPLAWPIVALAAAVLAGITAFAVGWARERPHFLVGWLWYLGTLLPVIGIVQVGGQAMADRYTYVPLLGIFVAVVWEIAAWPLWRRVAFRRAATAAAITILAALGVRTWQQTQVWRDTSTLWRSTLAVNPRAAVAYYGIGGLRAREGRVDEAIRAYRRALKLRPDYVGAHAELGHLFVRRRRLAAAAAHYRKAIAVRPAPAEDLNNLGNVLAQQGNLVAARRHLEEALRLRPGFAEAHNNLGIVLAHQGDLAAAVTEFRTALTLKPGFQPAVTNLRAVTTAMENPDDDEGDR
jgi:Flp pilus assembly protein TadD